MNEQPYTPTNLSRRIIFSDKCKSSILNNSDVRKKIGAESSQRVAKGLAFSSGLKVFKLGKKFGYGFDDISDTIISRLLARNIKAAYPATQSHRQFIVSNTISIMKECGAFNVFRYDIQNFYESIDRKLLLEYLIADGVCTWQTILLIRKLFLVLDIYEVSGLPRGLAVSGALAELRLLTFDRSMRHNYDVFFYARFVDDILIVTSERCDQLSFDDLVTEALPDELCLHDGDKRSFLPVPAIHQSKKRNESIQSYYTLSYLGYKIRISNNSTRDTVLGAHRRDVLVDISENKIQKLEDRLIKPFTNYISSRKSPNDFRLLKNRLRAITGNYEIRDPGTKINIRTGIYYSYIHKNTDDDCSLLKLDRFLRGLMFSGAFPLSQRIKRALTISQRKELIGYSFSLGYRDRRFHSFSYKSFEAIKKVWL
ncbi:reverse transcriptase (RNA-dependent DNA polymerase) [Pseudomonas helmanticensis]|uniref:Reverse transcriptase (RNA-dependent DNA polymerase) n=1 Tax=Pseudomonas helmanticensis TaxID=1471381 RepID=A0A4V3FT05_9PSED|nr:antiviral reverse transcriptase Drt3a [Pseudomonas helmanticensis]TDV49471.1 reverse transcriptase (RNA-dependent DNA polymerase) [Pseudomonas helmanticensis]